MDIIVKMDFLSFISSIVSCLFICGTRLSTCISSMSDQQYSTDERDSQIDDCS